MAKYSVVDESNDGYNAWVCWEGDSLEEAKKWAQHYDYINRRDANDCHTILVESEPWDDGDYDLIPFDRI